MKALIASAGLGLMIGLAAQAQTGMPAPCVAGDRPSFDVVSVKPSQTRSGSSSMRSRPDGMLATGSVRRLVVSAYDLRDFQVTGGPDWMNTSTWEIAARIDPPDVQPPATDAAGRQAWNDRRMARLQSMLMDRFQLKCHMVTKELPVYDLVIGKSGSKLKETTAEQGKRGSMNTNDRDSKVTSVGTGVDLGSLTRLLASQVERTVVDKTGLTGSYDYTLTWAADDMHSRQPESDAASGPTIFTAVEEQLGLKLESAKGPVQVLVVDELDKPAEN